MLQAKMFLSMLFAPCLFLLGLGTASATSYLDPAASTVVTTIIADSTTVAGYGWMVLGAVMGGLIIMGIFKSYAKKGAGR